MNWRKRKVECTGSVLFRGTIPPRLKEFAPALKAAGATGKAVPAGDDHWAAELSHGKWGSVKAVCLRDVGRPPDLLIDIDPHLNAAERDDVKTAGSTVSVVLTGGRGDVLRDRKALLRWLRVLMADDGLAVMDHTAQRFWSRASLDDELSHDADLDVESLFTTHVVMADEHFRVGGAGVARQDDDDEGPTPEWLHTHGLAEMGYFDFDVLRPSRSLVGRGGFDALRVMAFGILEEAAKPGTERFGLGGGAAGDVRLVDVKAFNRRAARRDVALRDAEDEGHNADRVVLCDPPGRFLGKWFDRPKPCSWLQRNLDDGDMLIYFSDAATELMAERARATWGRLREWAAEVAEFEFPVIVKLGYATDAGGGGREHLWFEVNGTKEASVDATLKSSPFDIAAMKAGDRAEHPIEVMTDWSILTPVGMVTPRNTTPLRIVRENREALLEIMRNAPAEEGQT